MSNGVRPREIRWLTIPGKYKTVDHRAVVLRVEADRALAVWGQTAPGESDDVIVELGKPEARDFHIDRDTYFHRESVDFYPLSDFGGKIGGCPFRLFPKFERLADARLKERERDLAEASSRVTPVAGNLSEQTAEPPAPARVGNVGGDDPK
jgi:hypothetical protein